MLVEWYGDRVTEQVIAATRGGMDDIMSRCVTEAKSQVRVKTSALQGSIQMRPTVQRGSSLTGYWGSFSIAYARAVEDGSPPHMIFPRRKKALYWEGAAHPVPYVHHPGTSARPYLKPAADRWYPYIPDAIRARFAS